MTTETKPAKVLLVDDEQPILYALGVVMETNGVDVVTASSVDQALGLLEGVDVVVTDLEMPGRSGLDLAWVLSRGEDVVPVFGTKRRAYLEENLGALDLRLSESELAELEYIAPPGAAAGERYPDMSLVNR